MAKLIHVEYEKVDGQLYALEMYDDGTQRKIKMEKGKVVDYLLDDTLENNKAKFEVYGF